MGIWTLPEINKCCFCIPLRYGLIVWAYITLTINFIFICNQIKTIHKQLNKDERVLLTIVELMGMIVDGVLVTVLIVAAHKKNVKLLKLSLIGNLTSVIVYTLYSTYMVLYFAQMLSFLYQISSDPADINSLIWLLAGVASAICIEVLLKFYIMFLLRKEIKKLEKSRCQFNFVNNADETKCKMEIDVEMENGIFKPIPKDDDEKAEGNTFDKQTSEIGEGIEVIGEKSDYSFKNMTEIKCKIGYEKGITNEESLFLINNDFETN